MLNPVKVGDIAPDFNLKNFNDTNYTTRAEPEEALGTMKTIV
jgi:peroxiredoxin